jgi:lipid A 3-O-deacylase
LNSEGDTNFAAVGLAWRRDLSERLSSEFQFGYAIHDGRGHFDPAEARSRLLLGSRDLFRSALSLDWKASNDTRMGLQWVRLSHGQILGDGRNQGLDIAGLVMTYRFY